MDGTSGAGRPAPTVRPVRHRPRDRWAAWLAALAGFGLALGVVTGVPAYAGDCPGDDCTVEGDPEGAAYVGDGGLLLPADSFTGTADDRRDAAVCEGCRWALVPVCKQGGQSPGWCGPAAFACPADQRRLEVFLRRPGEPAFGSVGLVCVPLSGPETVASMARRLHDVVIERVPALAPSYQPAGMTLVGLPTLFASGQPERLDTRSFDLVGFAVVLDARASWAWRFGDGAELVTGQPGGGYPDQSVAHVYPRPGRYAVSVTAVWEGWFTVDGLGPFAVGGDQVTQADGLVVDVRQARAVLMGASAG